MNFIKSIFKKHLVCILSICFLIIFTVTVRVFAVAWPYAPGATLNPECEPTDPTCIVKGGWLLTGNAGTLDDGTYFIGTTNDIPFNIKVNNQKAGRIDSTLQNTFYGYQAGDTNTTGSDNTILGAFADVTLGTETNSIALGKGAIIDLPNQIVFGQGQEGTLVTNWKIAGVNYVMPSTHGNADDVLTATDDLGTLSWIPAAGGASIVQETSVDLTAAQIKTLNSVPVNTGISVGVGEAIEVISTSMHFTAGSIVFDDRISLGLKTNNASYAQVDCGEIDFTADSFIRCSLVSSGGTNGSALLDAENLLIKTSADPVADGNGTARIYITYRIITL